MGGGNQGGGDSNLLGDFKRPNGKEEGSSAGREKKILVTTDDENWYATDTV